MALFSSSVSYLGIDFSTRSIKVVELKNEAGKAQLVTYGYLDQESKKEEEKSGQAEEIGKLIKAVCQKAKITTNKVVGTLPARSVFSSIFNLPKMPKKELEAAVHSEAGKVIPRSIEEMILDWKVIEEESGGGQSKTASVDSLSGKNNKKFLKISQKEESKNIKILLTAAPKNLVKKHLEIFKQASLELLSLDTESFALIRSLIGKDKSLAMVIDIGSAVTNVLLVKDSLPILSRNINLGGVTITKAIADSLNISNARAEQFKYDIGMSTASGESDIPETVQATLTPLLNEIKYSLSQLESQKEKKPEKIILTGGSALLINLPTFLSQKFNLKVYLGDPWARIVYPQELKPVLDEIGPRFSVALGLAMREIQ